MISRVFTLMSLRSRSVLTSAITLPRFATGLLSSPEKNPSSRALCQLSDATEKEKIGQDQFRRRDLNTKPCPASDLSAVFTHPDQAIMEILSDFVENNKSSPNYLQLLWNLLTSARLKDLGVRYAIPLPDKQEWKASWHEEGKPNWLGNIPTLADDQLYYTASITGYIEKVGGKGGYGVILFDHYGRPIIADVGLSLKGKVPLLYYELQGVRSALQLAFNYGFGDKIKLYCNSDNVRNILDICLQNMSRATSSTYMGKKMPWGDDILCASCVGRSLFRQSVMEDFDLLFPIIRGILKLFYKLNNFGNVKVVICCGSDNLAKYFTTTLTREEEMGEFALFDMEVGFYEMMIKPDEFPEEVVDSIYNEVFKGQRVHSELLQVEKITKDNEHMHLEALFRKLKDYWTY